MPLVRKFLRTNGSLVFEAMVILDTGVVMQIDRICPIMISVTIHRVSDIFVCSVQLMCGVQNCLQVIAAHLNRQTTPASAPVWRN